MKRARPTFRIVFFSSMVLIIILAVVNVVLSNIAFRKFNTRLQAAGVKIRSLNVNLFTRSVTIKGFEFSNQNARDSASEKSAVEADSSVQAFGPVSVRVETIRASGINVLAFIKRRELQLEALLLSNGKVVADISSLSREQPANGNRMIEDLPISFVSLRNLAIEDITIALKNDTLVEHAANISLEMDEVSLSDAKHYADPNAYTLGRLKFSIADYKMTVQRSMYTLNVKQMSIDSRSQEMTIDSIVMLPKYSKYGFSRKLGKQVDRFVLRVPQITLSGLDFTKLRDTIMIASSVKIAHANLYVFRDKRLPFLKRSHTPLPVALIRTMPFGFAIDSLILADTKITYEEFPEEGFETGYIVFDHLQARVDRLSNRDLYPGLKQSVLHVNSRVMQNGVITVDFTLPYEKAQVYNAKGRISNLGLQRLNPMLESLAFIRVESGRLNALDFNFDYDDYASHGNMTINYENLKLAGLKKDKEGKENEVKSFALGLFVRKDKDREVPIEKRTGKIYYERDRRRAIFNVWVKSLFSGVKSSVVDPPSERKTLTRKERRDSLRDVRKANREKKKKERS